MLIAAKENRTIPFCEFYTGDSISGSFSDCVYRFAGNAENVQEENPRQFPLFGIGTYLKIVFNKQPERVEGNLAGQVALGLVKIYG